MRRGVPKGRPSEGRRRRGEARRQKIGWQAVPAGLVHHRAAQPRTSGPVDCPHFGPCGGCDLLHVSYADECRRKDETLRGLVAAHPFLVDTQVPAFLAAKAPLFWRTSLKIPFARRARRVVCGFYEPGSHRIVDLQTCAVQHPALVALVLATRELASRLRVSIYAEATQRGVLRHLVARVAPGTGEVLAGLVVRVPGDAGIRRLAAGLWRRFAARGLVGIVENVNPERTNVILGKRGQCLAGRSWLLERADGIELRASLDSFTQANPAQATLLYAEVLRLLGDVRGRRILELYAGSAPIGLRLARAGARVHAVERNPAAVRVGREAARRHSLSGRLDIHAGSAESVLEGSAASFFDTVVMDPPRRGLTPEVVERLVGLAPATLIYVSCNPKSLVRDLERLSERFAVRTLRGVDLFPRTKQIEVVAHLERSSS